MGRQQNSLTLSLSPLPYSPLNPPKPVPTRVAGDLCVVKCDGQVWVPPHWLYGVLHNWVLLGPQNAFSLDALLDLLAQGAEDNGGPQALSSLTCACSLDECTLVWLKFLRCGKFLCTTQTSSLTPNFVSKVRPQRLLQT